MKKKAKVISSCTIALLSLGLIVSTYVVKADDLEAGSKATVRLIPVEESTDSSTTEPSTTEPSTTEPSTTEPSTTEPSTTEPSTTEPSTTEPSSSSSSSSAGIGGGNSTTPSTTKPSRQKSIDDYIPQLGEQKSLLALLGVLIVGTGCGFFLYLNKKKKQNSPE